MNKEIDGSIYTGEWKKDKRHGKGVNINSKGIKKEGNWINNVFQGEGSACCLIF